MLFTDPARSRTTGTRLTVAAGPYPDVLVQVAVVRLGGRTADGQIVEGVLVPWIEIIMQLERNPAWGR